MRNNEISAADRTTIARITAYHPDIDRSIIADSISVRRLATIRTKLGRKHTGSFDQEGPHFRTGWVKASNGRHYYGSVIATHGSVWPNRTHSGPESFNESGEVPYSPPPEGWVYVP